MAVFAPSRAEGCELLDLRRGWLEDDAPQISPPPQLPARDAESLQLMPDAPDDAGEPRVALLLPPKPGRRPVLLMFSTIAAAVEAKRSLEGHS